MKRQEYNFPSARRGRLTQVSLSGDGLTIPCFLKIDRSSVSAPVFYRRSLLKKVKSEERPKERQPLIVEREQEVYEKDRVIIQEIVKGKEEFEDLKLITKLAVKTREGNIKEIKNPLHLVEKWEDPLEILPSCSRVSVVMGFRGGDDNRLEGLKKCIKCLREQTIDCYIILIEQDNIPAYQTEVEPLVDSYLFTYSSNLFNRGWAFNCGVVIAPDDLILLHDSDLLVPKNYIRECIKLLGTKDMALPWARILYLTEDSSKQYPGHNPKISSVITNHQAMGGSLFIRKNFYLKIGGMDERFEGWGGEDNAFYAKAVKLGRVNRAIPVIGMTLLHHYHKSAQKSHHHTHVNNNIQERYFRMSAHEIHIQVEKLGSIGSPLKNVNKKESAAINVMR